MYRNRRGGVPQKQLGPYIVIKDGKVHVAMDVEAKKALQEEMSERFNKRLTNRMNKLMEKLKKEEET